MLYLLSFSSSSQILLHLSIYLKADERNGREMLLRMREVSSVQQVTRAEGGEMYDDMPGKGAKLQPASGKPVPRVPIAAAATNITIDNRSHIEVQYV
jgi:hypothetical protein